MHDDDLLGDMINGILNVLVVSEFIEDTINCFGWVLFKPVLEVLFINYSQLEWTLRCIVLDVFKTKLGEIFLLIDIIC
jgi:hypothetical protein